MKGRTFFLAKFKALHAELYTLYLACRDRRVPWYAKVFVVIVIAYALSPIDIIPDFIPVLGYLDDLILIPIGIYLALKMIPAEVKDESREKAKADISNLKLRWVGLALIILAWLVIAGLIIFLLIRM